MSTDSRARRRPVHDPARILRARVFSVRRTFWGFLYQALNPSCPCREVVRQIQALFCLHNHGSVDEGTSGYCQARLRLPLDTLQRLRHAIAARADTLLPELQQLWHGLRPKVIDGSTLSMPDTPKNQRAYPQSRSQKPGCGFPLLKMVALFSLSRGVLLDYAKGNKPRHEWALLYQLLDHFQPHDLVIADRGFSNFVLISLLLLRGVGSLFRLHQARRLDWRQGQRLGKNDRLFTWSKPSNKPRYLPHFQLYARRWKIELWLHDIKTSMGVETLRCQSPKMVHKELEMFCIAYNLMRALMTEASAIHDLALERISFKGTVDAARQYSIAMAQARSKKKQRELVAELLTVLARDAVPERPGRCEPRAVKRRPKPFPLLNQPRRRFKEIPHRNRYWTNNPRKSKR